MARPRLSLEIFLVALGAILLEVSYTRVFSYKLVYFFTYFIIGLALLGLGAGGIFVSMARREWLVRIQRWLAVLCLAGAASVLLGYLIVAIVQVNSFELIHHSDLREGAKLLLISAALFVPFFCAGTAVATIFAACPERINRLYFADLAGAGLGCAASVTLMTLLSPPGCVILAGMFFALAGIRVAHAESRVFAAALGVLAALLGAIALGGAATLPEVVIDGSKRLDSDQPPAVLFSQWSPVFRVDVLANPRFEHVGYALIHDGLMGSILPRVDANPESIDRFKSDSRTLPFTVVPEHPIVTIVGSAGGREILTSLSVGASHVTGIELNPVTVSLLTTHFKDFTGRVIDDPRVTLVNAEGRAYFDGTSARSDLVWFVAPDSYAAMNAATSGAYVLAESYLYTVEMLETAFAHLTPRGVVCAQFGEINFERKPNRTTRYLTTAREAFRRLGITDFSAHVIVITTSGFPFTTSSILLRREPFGPDDVARVQERAAATSSQVRFGGTVSEADRPVTAAITLEGDALEQWYTHYPFDVRPVTDDQPFFWHFVSFRDAFRATLMPATASEEGMGERLLLVLLALVTVIAAITLLVPLLLRRAVWRTMPQKRVAFVYFAALGLGFMFLEVTLIQQLTLFLGYPTYSLTVTLFALLLATGLGSLSSEWVFTRARDRAVLLAGIVLIVLVLFYLIGLGPLTARLGWAPFPVRVLVTVAVLLPLGLCLGLFMPLGLRSFAALTPHPQEYVAWAWAVNGFFSVVASVLATLLSMSFGFQAVMLLAVGIYAVAIGAIRRLPAPA